MAAQNISGSANLLGINLKNAFNKQLKDQVRGKLDAYFTDMGKIYNSTLGASKLAAANRTIATAMRVAVLESYDERFSDHEVYRVGQNRLSGGVLRRALENPQMTQATTSGVALGNLAVLNAEAKHWYRLNFGTQGKDPLYPTPDIPLTFHGTRLGTITAGHKKADSFLMPLGVWGEGSGVGRFGDVGSGFGFYPTSKRKRRKPSDIAGRRFFDAGVVALAETMPIVYEDLVLQFVKLASKGKGPLA